ncbi:unnamed protein product [Closterium sp. NIES-53]
MRLFFHHLYPPALCCLYFPSSPTPVPCSVVLAYATAIAIMSYFYLVSGYYVTRKQMTMTLIWLHYISPFKYAYEALAINQFDR